MTGRTLDGPSAPTMLVSDLDGTLLGDPGATARFRRWWQTHGLNCRLVYATGRRYASAADSLQEAELPAPDAIITDVGTELRFTPFVESSTDWTQRWQRNWQMESVQQALDSLPELRLQPDDCQSPFKRSTS
jgi:hydroxymethylpyrimidine pyrophosphatase-like HAD family hydrolase